MVVQNSVKGRKEEGEATLELSTEGASCVLGEQLRKHCNQNRLRENDQVLKGKENGCVTGGRCRLGWSPHYKHLVGDLGQITVKQPHIRVSWSPNTDRGTQFLKVSPQSQHPTNSPRERLCRLEFKTLELKDLYFSCKIEFRITYALAIWTLMFQFEEKTWRDTDDWFRLLQNTGVLH